MSRVYRTQRIEGTLVWGIIRNGGYYLNTFGVYEDGVVNCWHKSDLWQFQEDLSRQWVVPSVPAGDCVSIFHLGNFKIKEAKWKYGSKEYFKHVKGVVKSLNPEMQNLYRTTEREKEKWKKHCVGLTANHTSFKVVQDIGYFLEDGKGCYIFYRKESKLYLTVLTAFADGTLQIAIEENKYYTIEEIEDMFDKKILCTKPKEEEWVTITDLGEVLFEKAKYAVSAKEKKVAVRELWKAQVGEEIAYDVCIRAYHAYLENPCEWTKEKLKEAYEAVPEHERCYLGDMDTRDTDYCRILYTDIKREV